MTADPSPPSTPAHSQTLSIIGAGLAGALLATLLARKGWQVQVYEKRGDPRIQGYPGGRSINLALAERGRHALRQANADDAVMRHAVMMRGRMIHPLQGTPQLQRYGRDDSEVIWSVHRSDLNITLLDLAERAGARLHFHRSLARVDFDRQQAVFIDERDNREHHHHFTSLIGADGAGSSLRSAMAERMNLGERTQWLDHSYKELEIPPTSSGDFQMEAHALHIWPRGHYMCIALPNHERTFTVTLFLPNHGDPSFDSIRTPAQARALFQRDFPDALPLIPHLENDWAAHPVGRLATLYLDHWHLDHRAVLLGDAAHAMVPFHGQGMNCAFEDCVALAEHLQRHPDRATAFAAFQRERQPNAQAIQAMALENYVEMRDKVDDAAFLLQRELEHALQHRHPDRFIPHYSMVTFLRIPYQVALQRSQIQHELLTQATAGLRQLAQVDWTRLDAAVLAGLSPLDTAAA